MPGRPAGHRRPCRRHGRSSSPRSPHRRGRPVRACQARVRRDPLADSALADRRAARAAGPAAARSWRSPGPARSGISTGSRRPSAASRPTPASPSRTAASAWCPRRTGSRSTCRARRRRSSPQPCRPRGGRRSWPSRSRIRRARRTTRRAWASPASSPATRRRTVALPDRLHNVQLVAQLIDGALIAPGSQFSFNGTTGERTADKGFEEAPVIINGELQNGLGGGDLPGLHDRLQRRVRRGPADRPAHEPRALHQPLPDRARCDGQLPRPRSQDHERHAPLAAAADVRRLGLADRRTSTARRRAGACRARPPISSRPARCR